MLIWWLVHWPSRIESESRSMYEKQSKVPSCSRDHVMLVGDLDTCRIRHVTGERRTASVFVLHRNNVKFPDSHPQLIVPHEWWFFYKKHSKFDWCSGWSSISQRTGGNFIILTDIPQNRMKMKTSGPGGASLAPSLGSSKVVKTDYFPWQAKNRSAFHMSWSRFLIGHSCFLVILQAEVGCKKLVAQGYPTHLMF